MLKERRRRRVQKQSRETRKWTATSCQLIQGLSSGLRANSDTNCFFLQEAEWSRSYREIVPLKYMTRRFLHHSPRPDPDSTAQKFWRFARSYENFECPSLSAIQSFVERIPFGTPRSQHPLKGGFAKTGGGCRHD